MTYPWRPVPPQHVPWDSEWREIPGFPGYWMSQYRQIFVMKSGRILSEWSNRWYGSYVTLRRYNKAYSRKVQTLYELVFADDRLIR